MDIIIAIGVLVIFVGACTYIVKKSSERNNSKFSNGRPVSPPPNDPGELKPQDAAVRDDKDTGDSSSKKKTTKKKKASKKKKTTKKKSSGKKNSKVK